MLRRSEISRNVYTVGKINTYIKNMFLQDYVLSALSVEGEVSNCTYHGSGHIYFTLKDSTGTLSCVMFAGSRKGLTFRLEKGQRVIVSGSIRVFERDGKYQMYAASITHAGRGDLYEEYERRREAFLEMGLFSGEYKKPIPRFAKNIGIVTAPTGAAIRDIVNISNRRNPYVQLILYPALVQGAEAAESIAQGIQTLDSMGLDCIIVGRGGGSIEDLWAFNEDAVVYAIFNCRTPVISAVGHETDTTIADYVADLRAPTPSAAAELAVFDVQTEMERLGQSRTRLRRQMQLLLDLYENRINEMQYRLRLLHPRYQLEQKQQLLSQLSDRLDARMRALLHEKKTAFSLLAARLEAQSPLKRLSGGYVYARTAAGAALESAAQVAEQEELTLYVKDGILRTVVTGRELFRKEDARK